MGSTNAGFRDGAPLPPPVATAWDAGRRLGLASLTSGDGCLHLVLMDVRPDGKTRFSHLSSTGHRAIRARSRLAPGSVDPTPAGIEFATRPGRAREIFAVGTISGCATAFIDASRAWGAWPGPDAAIATQAWDAMLRRCGPACLSVLAEDGFPGWLPEADALLGSGTVDGLLTLYPFLAGPLRGYVRKRRESSVPPLEPLSLGDLSPRAVADAVIAILDGDGSPADALNFPPDRDDPASRRKAVARLLSRLQGVHVPAGKGADVLRAIGHVPYDWIPGDAGDAVGMAGYVRAAATLSKASRGVLPVGPLIAPSKGRWHEAHTALAASDGHVLQGDVFPHWTGDVSDMVQAFRLEVLAPAVAHADAIPSFRPPRLLPARSEMDTASWEALFEGMGLPAVLRASREWHRRSAHITQGIMAIDGNAGLSWPSPFETFVAPNGLTVVPMLSSNDLVDEGISLLHCVAGYAAGCAEGRHAIGSVRTAGRRTSTVQLESVPWADGSLIVSSQHRGSQNRDPHPADVEAVAALVAHLQASGPPVPFPPAAPARAVRGRRRTVAGAAAAAHPYDPASRSSVERAVHLWSGFLPRTARDAAGVVALVDAERARTVTQDMARTPARKRIRRVLAWLRMRFLRPWHPPGTERRGAA